MTSILVAEGNSDLRTLLRIRLQRSGFECIQASTGLEVIEILDLQNVDLILMDMNMPELDGWQTTKAIRSNPAHEKLPIIGLTANSMPGDRLRAKVAGCNAFHSEPVEFEQLMKDVRRLLMPEGPVINALLA